MLDFGVTIFARTSRLMLMMLGRGSQLMLMMLGFGVAILPADAWALGRHASRKTGLLLMLGCGVAILLELPG